MVGFGRLGLAEVIAAAGTPDNPEGGVLRPEPRSPHGLLRDALGQAERPEDLADAVSSREGSAELAALPGNPGTMGHERSLCGRPCLHFIQGCCRSEDACPFCHAPHARNPTQLDKRRREALRALPLEETQALMLPLVVQSARAADDTEETARLLDDLASVCHGRSSSPPDRRIVSGLRRMTLRHLLAIFVDLMGRHGAKEPRAAAELLVEHLVSQGA